MKWKKGFLSHISSGWIASGKIFTIISLIILPSMVIILTALYDQTTQSFLKYTIINYEYIYHNIEPIHEIPFLFYSYYFFSYSVIAILIFIYPPYPFPVSLGKYFKERGFDNAVIEYEFVKKILYIAVPTFLILTVILPTATPTIELYSSIKLKTTLEQYGFTIAEIYSVLVVFAGLLKIILALVRKHFRLYFAKGCLLLISEKKDEVENMNYFVKGLDSYNSYLRRNLHLQINDLKKFYLKIIRASAQEKKDVMTRMSKAFADDNLEIDTLRPLRELQKEIPKFLKTTGISEKFLTKQPLFDKIKDQSALAATIIPLAISMFELYLKFKP
jgi:hypothetical protein